MNNLKYINGALWGLKIAVKVISKCKDINKGIIIICKIQDKIKKDQKLYINDNTKLWCTVENIVHKIKS